MIVPYIGTIDVSFFNGLPGFNANHATKKMHCWEKMMCYVIYYFYYCMIYPCAIRSVDPEIIKKEAKHRIFRFLVFLFAFSRRNKKKPNLVHAVTYVWQEWMKGLRRGRFVTAKTCAARVPVDFFPKIFNVGIRFGSVSRWHASGSTAFDGRW